MNLPVRARGYDLFKLIIAIILLLLLFYLLWRPVPQIPSPGTEMPTLTSPPPASTTVLPSQTITAATTIAPSPATETLTATPILPAVTDIPSAAATQTLTPVSTPTTIVEIPAEQSVCEAISKSRLRVGMNAITKVRLNFRLSPGILNNRVLTMPFNTKVAVIGGPSCTRYVRGAYLWWQIKLPDGQTGWSAEASLLGRYYFLQPLP